MILAHDFVNARTMNYSTDIPVPVLTCFDEKRNSRYRVRERARKVSYE
jgi:hypothetical protein